jgi:hypothetical protein
MPHRKPRRLVIIYTVSPGNLQIWRVLQSLLGLSSCFTEPDLLYGIALSVLTELKSQCTIDTGVSTDRQIKYTRCDGSEDNPDAQVCRFLGPCILSLHDETTSSMVTCWSSPYNLEMLTSIAL